MLLWGLLFLGTPIVDGENPAVSYAIYALKIHASYGVLSRSRSLSGVVGWIPVGEGEKVPPRTVT